MKITEENGKRVIEGSPEELARYESAKGVPWQPVPWLPVYIPWLVPYQPEPWRPEITWTLASDTIVLSGDQT